LHIGNDKSTSRQTVFDAFFKDIRKSRQNGIKFDFIAFTGDVANSGKLSEYDCAREDFINPLLDSSGLSPDKLIIVPGNHDSDWGVLDWVSKDRIKQIKNEDDIENLLKNDISREMLLKPFANFNSFIRSFSENSTEEPHDLFSIHNIEKGGYRIAIIAFNSAWLSGFNLSASGTVSDMGFLAIGDFQVQQAFRRIANSEPHIVICLFHHPFEWLLEDDRNAVSQRILSFCDIILHGHLHQPNVIFELNLSGKIIQVPAGSIHLSGNHPTLYSIGQIDLTNGNGSILLRRYSRDRNEWQRDIISTGEDRNGKVNFNLSKWWTKSTRDPTNQISMKISDYKGRIPIL
jgi:predicted phosphodiesterase